MLVPCVILTIQVWSDFSSEVNKADIERMNRNAIQISDRNESLGGCWSAIEYISYVTYTIYI